ncbi:MAG: RDD family protein [Myxococcaceae bacterium]
MSRSKRSERAKRRVLRLVSGEERETGSPYPKCSLWLRTVARCIDLCIAAGIYNVTGAAGAVMALLFLLMADGLLPGQSLGKRIAGIKVVHLPTRQAARFRESMLRNAPFGLVVLFGMMPPPLGQVAFIAGTVFIGTVEAYRAVRDPLGIRLGDIWAETQVIDGKVVAGMGELTDAADGARAPTRVMRANGEGREQCESR